jgi:hypothetical protein
MSGFYRLMRHDCGVIGGVAGRPGFRRFSRHCETPVRDATISRTGHSDKVVGFIGRQDKSVPRPPALSSPAQRRNCLKTNDRFLPHAAPRRWRSVCSFTGVR